MKSQPIELLQAIISHIPTHLLYDKCRINRTWHALVGYELRQRLKELDAECQKLWNEYNEEYSKVSSEEESWDSWEYEEVDHYHTLKIQENRNEQFEIKDKMYRYGMMTDVELNDFLDNPPPLSFYM